MCKIEANTEIDLAPMVKSKILPVKYKGKIVGSATLSDPTTGIFQIKVSKDIIDLLQKHRSGLSASMEQEHNQSPIITEFDIVIGEKK